MFEDYKTKESVVIVYTGDGKGKTSASLGLMLRALGTDWRVAYVQFVKAWEVGEHKAIKSIQSVYKDKLELFKGGEGFYNAGDISAKGISEEQHRQAAKNTYKFALEATQSGKYDLVICDELNNSVHDGLLSEELIEQLIKNRNPKTSLCITGRNFPEKYLDLTDIATNMTKLKHHFDDKYLANKGIDY